MTDTTETPTADSRNLLQRFGDRLHRFADWLDNWHVTRIFNALSAFAILLAVTAFTIDMVGRTEERIARAWQLVTTKAPGNSGKIQALEYLNSEDWWWPFKKRVPLVGIDLSNDDPVYLKGIRLPRAELSSAKLQRANLESADLRGIILWEANLEDAWLRYASLQAAFAPEAEMNAAVFIDADLNDAVLVKTNLSSAFLAQASLRRANLERAKFSDTTFWDADLSEANLTNADLTNANLNGVNFTNANLSYANLDRARGLTQEQLDQAWAWEGAPPINLPTGLTVGRLCAGGDWEEFESQYRWSIDEKLAARISPPC